MNGGTSRLDRVTRIVGAVIHEALRVTGTRAIVLLDAESPEGQLFQHIAEISRIELTEFSDSARTLTAHPANKTALLVGEFIPRVDLLPFGDLYATQVMELADGWTGDDAVTALAAKFGGIEGLDAALTFHLEARATQAELDARIGSELAEPLLAALWKTRFRRGRAGLVPKLGTRTIGVDLYD